MNRNVIRQVVNVVAMVATIVMNGLAVGLPLNGQTTGEISDQFQVYFVPAGYVFSIWSVIYLGLILFAIYQALPSQRENPRLMRVGYLFALSSLANILWLVLFHYEQFVLTLVVMLILLGSLIAIYLRLEIGRSGVTTGEKWFVQVPFSIYLGWVSVATIANFTQTLDYLNWSGWGLSDELWAVIMLWIATFIGMAMYVTRRDVAYVLVLIWAFIGIMVKHFGPVGLTSEAAVYVVGTAAVTALLLALMLVFGGIRNLRGKPSPAATS